MGNGPDDLVTTETLTNGSVTFTPPYPIYGGPNPIAATYLGDSNYTSGTGSAVVDTFEMPSFAITLNGTTAEVNQSLSLTVTVSGRGDYPAPTGTVTLSSGSYTSSPVQLAAGAASFTIPANTLPVGQDILTATYSGDSYYSPGSSNSGIIVSPIPPSSFAITGTAITLTPGSTTGNASAITVTPSNGFTGGVALTAVLATSPANAVSLPTFSFGSTTPVNITGTANGTATLTVTTTAASSGGCSAANSGGSRPPWQATGGALLAGLLFLFIPARRRWRSLFVMLALLVALTCGVLSCGGSGSGSSCSTTTTPAATTPGTYTVTVTGTSGTTTASTTVSLDVM
jgi:hypothetical protein